MTTALTPAQIEKLRTFADQDPEKVRREIVAELRSKGASDQAIAQEIALVEATIGF